jgi:hypothetical protein
MLKQSPNDDFTFDDGALASIESACSLWQEPILSDPWIIERMKLYH